ncbi:MAG: molybdopterin-guanine dinucleotide biosynthesis protein B [Rhodocyclaceae bacterium]|nr:molybdopterin-guanine dinucleotide biosynthesis protein B [Rhodocyclaceae bacterium]
MACQALLNRIGGCKRCASATLRVRVLERGRRHLKRVFGFVGYSGSGKTTLIERLIARFAAQSLRVAAIKHCHHGFDIDRPGKDSYRYREAGSQEVLLVSGARWALLHELGQADEPAIAEQLTRLSDCDLVLVEGFKSTPIPKMEVFRTACTDAPLYPWLPGIVAVAGDAPPAAALPWFELDDLTGIADFVLARAERI